MTLRLLSLPSNNSSCRQIDFSMVYSGSLQTAFLKFLQQRMAGFPSGTYYCVNISLLGPQVSCICLLYACTIFNHGYWMARLKVFAGDDLLARRSRTKLCFSVHCATDWNGLLHCNNLAKPAVYISLITMPSYYIQLEQREKKH